MPPSEAQAVRDGAERIVVTGIGIISPIGIGRAQVWESLMLGRSGAGPITRFDSTGFRVRMACEIDDFHPEDFVDRKRARRMDRFSQLAVGAARLALDDAGLSETEDVGAMLGSGAGGAAAREEHHDTLLDRGPDRVSPFAIPATVPNMGAAHVSMELGLRGPLTTVATACASGSDAMGMAWAALRRGDAPAILAGGSDAVITPFWVAGFDAMRVLSRRNDDPAGAARPFDRDRDGFLIGEAGVVFVLERLPAARARGAAIIAEVVGYGASADAHHIADPDPTGRSQSRALAAALRSGGIARERVGYVNAHGGASGPGDPAETRAIAAALGVEVAARTPVSSTKAIHGHCMGAAGALEGAITAMAVANRRVPPTLNLRNVDPDCDRVDHVTGGPRDVDLDVAVSLSSGLGGHNAALCFARVDNGDEG